MPESAVEYRLGQLDASVKALIAELRDMRTDVIDRISQHDSRDDERFGSHSHRIETLEKKQAIDEHDVLSGQKRREGWRFLITICSSSAVGALISWLLHSGVK